MVQNSLVLILDFISLRTCDYELSFLTITRDSAGLSMFLPMRSPTKGFTRNPLDKSGRCKRTGYSMEGCESGQMDDGRADNGTSGHIQFLRSETLKSRQGYLLFLSSGYRLPGTK